MPFEKLGDGGIAITGKEDIALARLMALQKGLEFEIKTGMKLSAGRTCYAIIKAEFGLKGSKPRVLEQFVAIVDQAKEARSGK